MIVSSRSFVNNGIIPLKHTGFGEDLSPELMISDVPEATVSLAIVLDDLDVPFTKAFNHWIVWNSPKTDVSPEGLPMGQTICAPIPACQGMAWGRNCYRGPKPPFFIRNIHRYVFRVYALDCRLDLPESSDKKRLLVAMSGHILAEAQIIGKFERK